MDDAAVKAFADAWFHDSPGVIDEIVALRGDNPHTPYGAAVAAAMAGVPDWKPDA